MRELRKAALQYSVLNDAEPEITDVKPEPTILDEVSIQQDVQGRRPAAERSPKRRPKRAKRNYVNNRSKVKRKLAKQRRVPRCTK